MAAPTRHSGHGSLNKWAQLTFELNCLNKWAQQGPFTWPWLCYSARRPLARPQEQASVPPASDSLGVYQPLANNNGSRPLFVQPNRSALFNTSPETRWVKTLRRPACSSEAEKGANGEVACIKSLKAAVTSGKSPSEDPRCNRCSGRHQPQ